MCRCDIWNCCILCAVMHQKAWVQTQTSSSSSSPSSLLLIQKKMIMIASMEVMKITKDICKHSTIGLSGPTFSLQQHPSAEELKRERLQFRLISFMVGGTLNKSLRKRERLKSSQLLKKVKMTDPGIQTEQRNKCMRSQITIKIKYVKEI